jgi:membrane fusion protein (multidrug efflux system)
MKVLCKRVFIQPLAFLFFGICLSVLLYSCGAPHPNPQQGAAVGIPSLPVITIDTVSTIVSKEYTGSLEGKVNVEIRPQVDGYLRKIYIDEGSYVTAGQPLFKIDDRPYREILRSATASLHVAEANLASSKVDVDKLAPLVLNKVISDVQLQTAKAGYQAAQAGVEQAKASIESARINLDYTLIKAPVSGFIGKIPYRLGSLVSRNQAQQLTMLSDVHEVYVYFGMSEVDFINFRQQYPGNSLQDKIKNVPPVSLILADNSEYPHKGRIGIIDGQFDKATGSISLRASFPNAQGLLRSGNTGKIRMDSRYQSAILVPQASTAELQDKIFVFVVADSNKVKKTAITVKGKSGNNYIVNEGVKAGDKIVAAGFDRLMDGTVIKPQPVVATADKGQQQ